MGVLTEAMMRLRGEIGVWRDKRAILQHDLSRQAKERRAGVSASRAGFARDRAGAHRAWFGPTLSERQAAERQQQRVADAGKAKAQREQRLPTAAKSHSRGHTTVKPVLARAHRPPLKGSKKH
jgi:hypothetical protein